MPAAAVIRMGRALFGIIGRKGRVGGSVKSGVKVQGLTLGMRWKLRGLSPGGGAGIPGVGVKSVDIRKNTGGEGELLARGLTLRRESVGSKQD